MWRKPYPRRISNISVFDNHISEVIGALRRYVGQNNLLGTGKNLLKCHRSRVEDDRVGGGLERRFGAIAIAIVALLHLLDDGLFQGLLLLRRLRIRTLTVGILLRSEGRIRGDLTVTPIPAHLRCGIEKDLDLGVREDGGANIASLHNDTASRAQSSLLLNHPGAELGMD